MKDLNEEGEKYGVEVRTHVEGSSILGEQLGWSMQACAREGTSVDLMSGQDWRSWERCGTDTKG